MNTRNQGKKAEEYVCKYLSTQGYKIIERNFTIRGGEIDIIASQAGEIVFVEVKSLHKDSSLDLAETISSAKKRHLIRSCRIWLGRNKRTEVDWRIDFVGIKFTSYDKITSLKHIRNAVY